LFPLISHKLLHALRLCARVVVTVALQEVDNTPDTKTCAQRDYKGLQYSDCGIEKCHIVFPHFLPLCGLKNRFVFDFGYKKAAIVWRLWVLHKSSGMYEVVFWVGARTR